MSAENIRQTADGVKYYNLPEAQGVWVVLGGEYGSTIEYVFPTELDAHRYSNQLGYYAEVLFIPWGLNVSESRELAKARSVNGADSGIGTETTSEEPLADGRDSACVERWPECGSFLYDPRCCRFPKSCSAG